MSNKNYNGFTGIYREQSELLSCSTDYQRNSDKTWIYRAVRRSDMGI